MFWPSMTAHCEAIDIYSFSKSNASKLIKCNYNKTCFKMEALVIYAVIYYLSPIKDNAWIFLVIVTSFPFS